MGSLIKATCKNCGYETEDLPFGGGFTNFTTHCGYPCVDQIRKEVVMANIFEKEKICNKHPNIFFYDDELLRDKTLQDNDSYIGWENYKLFQDGYYCPKCNQFRIGFLEVGHWD